MILKYPLSNYREHVHIIQNRNIFNSTCHPRSTNIKIHYQSHLYTKVTALYLVTIDLYSETVHIVTFYHHPSKERKCRFKSNQNPVTLGDLPRPIHQILATRWEPFRMDCHKLGTKKDNNLQKKMRNDRFQACHVSCSIPTRR